MAPKIKNNNDPPTKKFHGSGKPKTAQFSASVAASLVVADESQRGTGQLASIFSGFRLDLSNQGEKETENRGDDSRTKSVSSSPTPTSSRNIHMKSGLIDSGRIGTDSSTGLQSQRALEATAIVSATLKKLAKRSEATRIKALDEFTTYLKTLLESEAPEDEATKTKEKKAIEDEIMRWLPEFCRVYRATVLTDSERRIRHGLNRSLESISRIMGKLLAPFLRSIFPSWWISCFDPHQEVATAAKNALETSFPSSQLEKQIQLFEYCRDCLIDELFRLLSQTEVSLHLDLFGDTYTSIPLGIREERYDRVISGSLLATSQLITIIGKFPDRLLDWRVDLKPLFGSPHQPTSLTNFLSLKSFRPAVRRSAAQALSHIFDTFSSSSNLSLPLDPNDDSGIKLLTSLCLGIFSDHDADVQSAAPNLFISFLRLFPERFSHCQPAKLVYPRLLSSIRHNGYAVLSSDVSLWRHIPSIVAAIPISELLNQQGCDFLRSLCPSVLLSFNQSQKSSSSFIAKPNPTEVFLSYFQILIFLLEKRLLPAAKSPGPSDASVVQCLTDDLIEKWFWVPVELYLCSLCSSGSLNLLSRIESSSPSLLLLLNREVKKDHQDYSICLESSDLSSIPPITGWALDQCLMRSLPVSILNRLESFMNDAVSSIFRFTHDYLMISPKSIDRGESLILFMKLLIERTSNDVTSQKIQTGNQSIVSQASRLLGSLMLCLKRLLEENQKTISNIIPVKITLILKSIKSLLTNIPLITLSLPNVTTEYTSTENPDHSIIDWFIQTSIALLRIAVISFTSRRFDDSRNRQQDRACFSSHLAILSQCVSSLIVPVRCFLSSHVTSDVDPSQIRFTQQLDALVVQTVLTPSIFSVNQFHVLPSQCFMSSMSHHWDKPLQLNNQDVPDGCSLTSLLISVHLLNSIQDSNIGLNLTSLSILPVALNCLFRQASIHLVNHWNDFDVYQITILQKPLLDLITCVINQYSDKSKSDSELSINCLCVLVDLFCGYTNQQILLKILKSSIVNKNSGAQSYGQSLINFVCVSILNLLPALQTLLLQSTMTYSGCLIISADHLFEAVKFCFEVALIYHQFKTLTDDRSWKETVVKTLTSTFLLLHERDNHKAYEILSVYVVLFFDSVLLNPNHIHDSVDVCLIFTNLLPNGCVPSLLGVRQGFWDILDVYYSSMDKSSLPLKVLSLPEDSVVSVSCFFVALFIAADCPMKMANTVEAKEDCQLGSAINQSDHAADLIITIWLGQLCSHLGDDHHNSKSLLSNYLNTGLIDILIPRIWFDLSTPLNPAYLLDRLFYLYASLDINQNVLSADNTLLINYRHRHLLESLFYGILDLLLIDYQLNPNWSLQSYNQESDYQQFKLVRDVFVSSLRKQFTNGNDNSNQTLLINVWDMRSSTTVTILSMFLDWVCNQTSMSFFKNDGDLFELRNSVFLSVADAIDVLRSSVLAANPGEYPANIVIGLTQSLSVLAKLFMLTDTGDGEEVDISMLYGTGQQLYCLAESANLLITSSKQINDGCISETGLVTSQHDMIQLKFIDSLSEWVFFLATLYPNHDARQDIACSALLAMTDAFLNTQSSSDVFIFLPHCLRLLTLILEASSVDHSGVDLLQQIEYSVIEASLCHLTFLDSVINESPIQFSIFVNSASLVTKYFNVLGAAVVQLTTNSETPRIMISLEDKHPIIESIACRIVCLLTCCAMEWQSVLLSAPVFQMLHVMNFPWFRIPILHISNNNEMRNQSLTSKSNKSRTCDAGLYLSQLFQILEESSKDVTETKQKLSETSVSGTLCLTSFLSLCLGESLGNSVGRIDLFFNRLLSHWVNYSRNQYNDDHSVETDEEEVEDQETDESKEDKEEELIKEQETDESKEDKEEELIKEQETDESKKDKEEELIKEQESIESSSVILELRKHLNFWLILLSSLRYNREEREKRFSKQGNDDNNNNDDDDDDGGLMFDPSIILELRSEFIQSKSELYYRLCKIAKKTQLIDGIEIVSTHRITRNQGRYDAIKQTLQQPENQIYDNRPLIYKLLELLALVLLVSDDDDGGLFDHNRKSLITDENLRVPPTVSLHLALAKRGLRNKGEWIIESAGKLLTIMNKRQQRQDKNVGNRDSIIDNKKTDSNHSTESVDIHENNFQYSQADWMDLLRKDASIRIESIPLLSSEAYQSIESLRVCAARLLLLTAELFPVAFRQWVSIEQSPWLSNKLMMRFEHIVRSMITPRLLVVEIESVKRSLVDPNQIVVDDVVNNPGDRRGLMTVTYDRHFKQLRCRLTSFPDNELYVDVSIEFYDTHPLRCPNFLFCATSGIPVSKIEKWIFLSKQILFGGREISNSTLTGKSNGKQQQQLDTWESRTEVEQKSENQDNAPSAGLLRSSHSGGSVVAALSLFKANVNAFLSGLEECSICYAIVHGRTRSLPKQKCITCKYKFHSECLDRWFSTSQKRLCPLCQCDFR